MPSNDYVDLNDIHIPADDTVIPDGWGNQIRSNQERFYSPPGVMCAAGGNMNLPNGTPTPVIWTAADTWDTDNFHSPSGESSKVIIPTGMAGIYRTTAHVLFQDQTITGFNEIAIRVNGTVRRQTDWQPLNTLHVCEVTAEIYLADGDELEIWAFQNSGAAITIHHATYLHLSSWSTRWVAPAQ